MTEPTDGEIRLALINHALQVAARMGQPMHPEQVDYLRRILTTPPETIRLMLRPAAAAG